MTEDEKVLLKRIEKDGYENESPYTRLNEFEKRYRKDANPKTVREIGRRWLRNACSKRCLQNSLLNNFPFIRIMREYAPLRDLPSDVIAGVTVGIMQIPQGEIMNMH